MKKIFTCFILFFVLKANANHLLGGQIAVKYMGKTGPNQSQKIFEVSVNLFRDCLLGQASFDDSLSLGMFRLSDDSIVETLTMNLNSISFIGSFQGQACYQVGVYVKQIIIDQDIYLAYSRCC